MAVSEDAVAAGRTQRPGTDRGAFIGTPGLTIVRTVCLQRHFPLPCVSFWYPFNFFREGCGSDGLLRRRASRTAGAPEPWL